MLIATCGVFIIICFAVVGTIEMIDRFAKWMKNRKQRKRWKDAYFNGRL